MLDGRNTAEMLIANMNYARVSGCVVTQEYIDGNQDRYLLECKRNIRKNENLLSVRGTGDRQRMDRTI